MKEMILNVPGSCHRRINSLLRLLNSIVVVVFVTSAIFAQDAAVKPSRTSASTTVTATASAERVRFTAPSNVVRMQLQVISETGQVLFEVSSKGNVLDWSLQDSGGQRLQGSYLTLVTVKDLSGRLSERTGTVSVAEQQVELKPADGSSLLGAQQQAMGPVEENGGLIIVKAGEADTITIMANNGSEGQIIRDRGALSFRLGDFFSGTDKEQMRLTEEGNLGIGTTKPKVKLDVAGVIRAREGFAFSDGSKLNVNDRGALMLTSSNGSIAPNVTGTGTQNKLAKWTDNLGTLGDSVALDTGTGLQLTAAPSIAVDTNLLYLNSTNGTTGVLAGSTPSYGAANGPFFAMRGNTYTTIANQRGLFTIAAGNVTGPVGDDGSVKFNTGSDLLRMVIRPSGNVGIGVSNPVALLDVGGNINTTTQYNIGGSRLLSIPGTGNTFVGSTSGNANTTGQNNSFFGNVAGFANTTGNFNSFFGKSAGAANTTGVNNAFFGATAGNNNTLGSSNSFFGSDAGLFNTTGANNSFFGEDAGRNNTTAGSNSFFGQNAGQANTTGEENDFFGKDAGAANTTGGGNAFFGTSAGAINTTGFSNSFIGGGAGYNNTTGFQNSFLGVNAGSGNSTGTQNSFIGKNAGSDNTTGSDNTFVGYDTGESNTIESDNTFIGANSDGAAGITNATAIGANASVTQSDSVVLGNGAKVGIGTSAPKRKLHVAGDVFISSDGHGLVLKSPNGLTCAIITIDNAGALLTSVVACP